MDVRLQGAAVAVWVDKYFAGQGEFCVLGRVVSVGGLLLGRLEGAAILAHDNCASFDVVAVAYDVANRGVADGAMD